MVVFVDLLPQPAPRSAAAAPDTSSHPLPRPPPSPAHGGPPPIHQASHGSQSLSRTQSDSPTKSGGNSSARHDSMHGASMRSRTSQLPRPRSSVSELEQTGAEVEDGWVGI